MEVAVVVVTRPQTEQLRRLVVAVVDIRLLVLVEHQTTLIRLVVLAVLLMVRLI